MISGRSVILGVIGDPIKHSFSPYLHNSVASELGINVCYVPFQVKPADLQDAVAGLKAMGIKGFNVTVPHKERIIPLLDHCDADALAMGAVNTVVNKDGVLFGYNTDGKGFLYSLLNHHQVPIKDKHIVFLGAGGTAKALSYVCLQNQVSSITIINRSLAKASLLKEELLTLNLATDICVLQRDDLACIAALSQADLVINVTSLGMSADDALPFDSTDWFRVDQCLFDVIYNPKETRFLSLGRERGLKTINGLTMLAAQAAYAFELFLDVDAPMASFFNALESM